MSTAELVAPATVRAPARVSSRLLRSELGMTFRRRRNQVILVALGLIPVVIGVAVRVSTPDPADAGEGGPPFLFSIAGNGVFVGLAALTVALPLFLPLTVRLRLGSPAMSSTVTRPRERGCAAASAASRVFTSRRRPVSVTAWRILGPTSKATSSLLPTFSKRADIRRSST